MDWSITNLVPFDIGQSFLAYESSNLREKEVLINAITDICNDMQFEIIDSDIASCFLAVKLNCNISCYLLEYGIGVFVLENFRDKDINLVKDEFDNEIPCVIYYCKQKARELILKKPNDEIKIIREFMKMIWNLIGENERKYSASEKYKNTGLSYVLAIYHIVGLGNGVIKDKDLNIDILMNPSIISKVCGRENWKMIKNSILNHEFKGYNAVEYNASTVIASSWSAVAVIEDEETEAIKKVIDYEIELQASWFLFDCLIDNIKKNDLSNLDLQKEKSLATNVSLDISVILGANMSMSEKTAFESIYSTTGFEALRDKLFLLLENRIAIAEAKISEKQVKYGIITEMLLLMFTLVSIYDPLRNLANGSLQDKDIIVGCILIVLFIVYYIITRMKEK